MQEKYVNKYQLKCQVTQLQHIVQSNLTHKILGELNFKHTYGDRQIYSLPQKYDESAKH